MTKPCIRCGAERPLDEFYRHPRMADGHLNKCKTCCKAYARGRHLSKRERQEWVLAERRRGREKHKRLGYAERYRGRSNEAARTFRVRYPEKARAHSAVARAIRSGRLIRPDACTDCGAGERPIHAHHEDYSKLLDVMWLCVDCHMRRHRKAA